LLTFFGNTYYDIEKQCSNTALLLLVNPHQNSGTLHHIYSNYCLKICFAVSYIQQYESTTASAIKVATMKIMDDFQN